MSKPPAPMYPEQDVIKLEPHYSAHVGAMTREGLHAKSDIAAQLAWRDKRIADLQSYLAEVEKGLAALDLKLVQYLEASRR